MCFGNGAWPKVMPGYWAEDAYALATPGEEGILLCKPVEACLGDDGRGTMARTGPRNSHRSGRLEGGGSRALQC